MPLVFVVGDDPVRMGLVPSLNRPEGNITGVTFFGGGVLGAKRLELLRELTSPMVALVAVLGVRKSRVRAEMSGMETAARTLGLQTVLVKVAGEHDIDAGFDRIVLRAGAVLFSGAPLFRSRLRVGVSHERSGVAGPNSDF